MPKFRRVTGLFRAATPDGPDEDYTPELEALNGQIEFVPRHRGGVIAYPRLDPPEFVRPEPIQAALQDGRVMTQVSVGEETTVQPVELMVSDDDEATQSWQWEAVFRNIRVGRWGDEVSISPMRFTVPDEGGPLDLTEVVGEKSAGAVTVKGPRGAGITDITASDGVVTVEWDGGEDVTIPIPTAALATPSSDGLMSRVDKAEHDYLMGAGLVRTESIDPDEVQVRFDDSEDPILRISPERGIVGTPIVHEADTVDAQALTQDVRGRVMSVEEIPDWLGWDFAFRTQDRHVVFGRRSDGTWVGTEGMTAGVTTPTEYVAYGDSTTHGIGVDGVTAGWVEVLRDEYGIPIANQGLSGARAEEITARLGGIFPSAAVSGGEIPASGGVDLTDFDVDMVRTGGVVDLTVELITESNERVQGRLYRTGTTDRQFSRLTPGEAIPAQGRVEVASVTGQGHSSQARLFLAQGVNNEQMILDGEQAVEDLIGWYAAAAAVARHPLVVWGMLDRGPTEAVGTPRGDIIAEVEAWLRQRFGADFWPVRAYLASPQALHDAQLIDPSFEPTPEDLAAQDAATVPPSFRTGTSSVHLNEFGHQLQARFMYRQIVKRGWL